jgi:energy-converting hydrogenase Eha subunit A
MLDARSAAGAAAINSKLYLAGGFLANSTAATVEIYDPTTDRWTISANPMTVARGAAAAGTFGGKLYIAEGWQDTADTTQSNALEVYDPATDSWATLASSTVARGGVAAAVIGTKFYITGGVAAFAAGNINTLEIYDFINNSWTTGSPIPIAVQFPESVAFGSKLYVFGGYTLAPGGSQVPSTAVQIYDPGTNSWTSGADMPAFLVGGAAWMLDGRIYVADGGTDSGLTNIVEVYDPATNSWSTSTSAPTKRLFPAGAVIDNQMYLAGGGDNSGPVSTLETFSLAQVLSARINDTVTGTGTDQWDYGSSGWFYFNGSNVSSAYQKDERYAFTTGVTATFRFNGSQIKIYTVKEPHGGNIGYSLDGGPEQIISNYSPTIAGNSLSYTSPILAAGDHVLVIRVVGTHEAASDSNAITVDQAEVYMPAPPQKLSATINDSVTGTGNNQWDYGSSGWFYYSASNISSAYHGDEHYAFTTGVRAHLRFNGSQVKIYTVKEPHGGNIGYSLDGGPEQIISNYSPTVIGNCLSYSSPIVLEGQHDLVIRVVGSHEAASDANAITVDKAEVYVPASTQMLSATINDSVTGTGNNQWDYGMMGWFFYNGSNISTAYQGDEHYAFTTGVFAHFRFNGTQIKIYTVREPHGGNIGYSLDGGPEQLISNYSPTTIGNSLSYISPVISAGDHDLVIRVVGTHETTSDSNAITVDKAEVYTAP